MSPVVYLQKPLMSHSERLFQSADFLLAKTQPFAPHPALPLDDYHRLNYATMMASLLITEDGLSENEDRLLRLWLGSLALSQRADELLRSTQDFSLEHMREFLRTVQSQQLENCFLIDALILCRVDGKIPTDKSKILSQLIALLHISQEELDACSWWAAWIMGLETTVKFPAKRLKKATLMCVDADALQKLDNYTELKITANSVAEVGSFCRKDRLIAQIVYRSTSATHHRTHTIKATEKVEYRRRLSQVIKDLSAQADAQLLAPAEGVIHTIAIDCESVGDSYQSSVLVVPVSKGCLLWLNTLFP